jgi:hypothetical protein
MRFALWMLTNGKNSFQQRYKCNSKIYEIVKKEYAIASSELHKNKILSQETKDKISKAHKGKKLSEEHKEKINPKGRILSQETKDKISNSNKGKIGIMTGKTHSQETKDKISNSNKGKIRAKLSEERKLQISKQFSGTTQSEEHKTKRLSSRQSNGYYKNEAETKAKMSTAAKNRLKYTCHCGKECTAANYKRWHGEKCKLPS